MQRHSHKIILIHVNFGVRLCVVCNMRCALCGCPAFEFMRSVLQLAAKRTAVSGSAAVCEAVCGCQGMMRAAVCGYPAVRQCAAVQQ
jgi:hypothetical protein